VLTKPVELENCPLTLNSRSYLNRWLSPDTIIPNPYDPQSYDRYAYVRNNPINFNDPSGHFACEDGLSGCKSRTNTAVHDYSYSIAFWTSMIYKKYGITLANSVDENKVEYNWNLKNARTAYDSLANIDNNLNGHLKEMVSGTTFTIMGGGDEYYGRNTSPTSIEFHVKNDSSVIPGINFLHETGHLLDNGDIFSAPLNGPKPTWVTEDGYVDTNFLLHKYTDEEQARPMNEPFAPNEYWADAFANYMGGNIDLRYAAGVDMSIYVHSALAPYASGPLPRY
jgi:hypothetical protein